MNEKKLPAKVPQVMLLFWIIKILATTLGETGGDAVTMSWLGTGSAVGRLFFGWGGLIIATVSALFGWPNEKKTCSRKTIGSQQRRFQF